MPDFFQDAILARGNYGADPLAVIALVIVCAVIYGLLVSLGASKHKGPKPKSPHQQRRHNQKCAEEGLNTIGSCIGAVCMLGVFATIIWAVLKFIYSLF